MNKLAKLGLGVTGAALALDIAIMALNKRESVEDRTKRLVIKVWDSIKDDVVKALHLTQVPTLEWDGKEGCVMYVTNMIYAQNRSFFESVIVKTESDYIIHVNLTSLIKHLDFFKKTSFYMSRDVCKIFISQLLYHESRHIWQAQENFYLGKVQNHMNFSFNKGHGEAPEEKDANEFAITMAKTQKEKTIANLQKRMQEEAGKSYQTSYQAEKTAYLKEFNPILRLFL